VKLEFGGFADVTWFGVLASRADMEASSMKHPFMGTLRPKVCASVIDCAAFTADKAADSLGN
jgi:hypothetical protein